MRKKELIKYLEAGAYIRISKEIYAKTIVALSEILPSKDIPRGGNRKLIELSDKAEKRLCIDYPDLEHFQNVFYGSIQVPIRSDDDRTVMLVMRNILSQMLRVIEVNLKVSEEEAE